MATPPATTTPPADKKRTKPPPDTLRDAAKIRDIVLRHSADDRKLVLDSAIKAIAEAANRS